jgi:hypothetical protein
MRQSRLFLVLFLLTVAVIFFIPQTDVDFGWHYKCGQLLLAANPCIDNNFTYYLPDYKWAYPSFLFDAQLYLTYNLGGFVATSIVYSAFMSAFAFLLYKSTRLNKPIFIFLFLISTYFSWNVFGFGFRAQIITLVFIILFLALIKSVGFLGYKVLLITPIFFLIWVNTHAGFFLGPLFLILFVTCELVTSLFGLVKKKDFKVVSYYKDKSVKGYSLLALLTLSSVLATLINPFGYRVYTEIIHHGQTPMNMLIAEWTSPKPLVMLVMIIFYLFFLFLQFSNKKLLLFDSAVLTITLYLALTANRNVPLFFFSYIVFLGGLNILPPKVDKVISVYGKKFLINLFVVFILFVAPFTVLSTVKNSTYNSYCTNSDVKYPCKAIRVLEGKNVRVYNRYEWGGFLIWKLPTAKLFVDGRMPAWIDPENGKSPYAVWLDIYQTKPGWDEKLDNLKTDYLLISPYTYIDLELTENPEKYSYKEVYRDDISVIYER